MRRLRAPSVQMAASGLNTETPEGFTAVFVIAWAVTAISCALLLCVAAIVVRSRRGDRADTAVAEARLETVEDEEKGSTEGKLGDIEGTSHTTTLRALSFGVEDVPGPQVVERAGGMAPGIGIAPPQPQHPEAPLGDGASSPAVMRAMSFGDDGASMQVAMPSTPPHTDAEVASTLPGAIAEPEQAASRAPSLAEEAHAVVPSTSLAVERAIVPGAAEEPPEEGAVAGLPQSPSFRDDTSTVIREAERVMEEASPVDAAQPESQPDPSSIDETTVVDETPVVVEEPPPPPPPPPARARRVLKRGATSPLSSAVAAGSSAVPAEVVASPSASGAFGFDLFQLGSPQGLASPSASSFAPFSLGAPPGASDGAPLQLKSSPPPFQLGAPPGPPAAG